MSWLGNWVGKYLGNWLGLQGASGGGGITVTVAPAVLSLVTTAAIVATGASFSAAPATTTLVSPSTVVRTGSHTTVLPSTLSLVQPPASTVHGAKHTALPTVAILSLVDPIVKLGVTVPATWTGIVLNVTTPNVVNGVTVNPFESIISVTARPAVIHTASLIQVSPITVTLSQVTPFVRQSIYLIADITSVASDITVPVVTWGAIANVSALDLTIDVSNVSIAIGAIATVDAVDVFINVVVPRVYDRTGSITYPASLLMKVNIPEIIAFSTDITTDMQVIEGIEMDMDSVDGTQPVKLLRRTDNVVMDFIRGEAVPENKIYVFPVALIRMISTRDNRAVKQLRLFMQSVQNDEMATMDTIIELPKRDDVQIRSGDLIESDLMGTRYSVIAIDDCTLKTRWRIGARKLI